MPTHDSADELLPPGNAALCVYTDGRHFVHDRADGTGSTGRWRMSRPRNIDRVIVYWQKTQGGQRFGELYTATFDGAERCTDGRWTIKLRSIVRAGSTDGRWQEFAGRSPNPIRYVRRKA